ncbi:MAG: response regulator [Bacteroidota bacterium]
MNTLRVLIIEDEVDDANLLLHELKKTKFNIYPSIVADEKKLKTLLKSWEPDLIISDYYIPGFSGAEALLMSKNAFPEIPFIFVTGKVDRDLAKETILNSTDAYVLKDEIHKLSILINTIIDKKELFLKDKNVNYALKDAKELVESAKLKTNSSN